MLNQPLIGDPNQSSKACWACPTTTPYNQGFCDTCWASIPPTVQRLYCDLHLAEDIPPRWQGLIRAAIADGLKIQLRPRTRIEGNWSDYHRRKTRPTTPLTLGDLGL